MQGSGYKCFSDAFMTLPRHMYLDTCEFSSLVHTHKTFQDVLKCPSDALNALQRHMYLDTCEFCSLLNTPKTFQDALKALPEVWLRLVKNFKGGYKSDLEKTEKGGGLLGFA